MLLAAGGTGGHLQPALAVAAEAQDRGARVVVVTTPSQVGHVAPLFETHALELSGFARRLAPCEHARALWLLAAAVPRVERILRRVRPEVVVGAGGFSSGPVVALAALHGIPGVALEADAHLGVANRLLRPFVRRVCLSFPIAGLEPPRFVVTGRPLSVAQTMATAAEGREAFGLEEGSPVLLVFGGSQGARSINSACVEAFGGRDSELQVVHVCGARNHAAVRESLEARGERFERYHLVAYTDLLAQAMAAADLVVARSGGSIAELAALGKPAVLVPYPHATADHQRLNAQWMVAAGAAVLVDDDDLNGAVLGGLVAGLLGDRARLAAMAAASAALGKPDATRRVVGEVEDILTERSRR